MVRSQAFTAGAWVQKKQNKTVLYLNVAKQSRSLKFSSQEKKLAMRGDRC